MNEEECISAEAKFTAHSRGKESVFLFFSSLGHTATDCVLSISSDIALQCNRIHAKKKRLTRTDEEDAWMKVARDLPLISSLFSRPPPKKEEPSIGWIAEESTTGIHDRTPADRFWPQSQDRIIQLPVGFHVTYWISKVHLCSWAYDNRITMWLDLPRARPKASFMKNENMRTWAAHARKSGTNRPHVRE